MLFGSKRDYNLFVKINRELLSDIVEQSILYYKNYLEGSNINIYGESLAKEFLEPVKLDCLITRGDQVISVDDFGPDLTRDVSFAFLREDLVDVNVVPEVGDVLMWHENYYEVDIVRENQLILGRDSSYPLTTYADKYGTSVSIIVDCHLTRVEKFGITPQRL